MPREQTPITPPTLTADEPDQPAADQSRRVFLLAGLSVLLTGCASQPQATSSLPGPIWRPRDASARPRPQPYRPPSPAPTTETASSSAVSVIPRAHWAAAGPIPSRMNRMTPVNTITVHHDGMSAFYETDERNTISRLESIRRFHRDNRGWGDIGYHYIIDRTGRVWEGRPIVYQGAHVSNHNEGNVGVLLLGNFDQQTPSSRQLEALNASLSGLMRTHSVPMNRIVTHREWDGARTACPGAALQSHMDAVRRRGYLG